MDDFVNYLAMTPKFVLIFGAGGTGKTTTACATAAAMAKAGGRVLLASLDDTHLVESILDTELRLQPVAVTSVEGLFAFSINPQDAETRYRERLVRPYKNVLPTNVWSQLDEHVSNLDMAEIAVIDEVAKLMTDSKVIIEFDQVVFDFPGWDKAYRLLEVLRWFGNFSPAELPPRDLIGFTPNMIERFELYGRAFKTIASRRQSTCCIIARPDKTSVAVTQQITQALCGLGIARQSIGLNFATTAIESDPISQLLGMNEQSARQDLAKNYEYDSIFRLPLLPSSPKGASKLRLLAEVSPEALEGQPISKHSQADILSQTCSVKSIVDVHTDLSLGLWMIFGKGGTGRSQLACALAKELSARGSRPVVATNSPATEFSQRLIQMGAKRFCIEAVSAPIWTPARMPADVESMRLTTETDALRTFARLVELSKTRCVIIDAAPAIELLNLLSHIASYRRDCERNGISPAPEICQIMPTLCNPQQTTWLATTTPDMLTTEHTHRMERQLKLLGIEVYAWIFSQSLLPVRVSEPLLNLRQQVEMVMVKQLLDQNRKVALLPWQSATNPATEPHPHFGERHVKTSE